MSYEKNLQFIGFSQDLRLTDNPALSHASLADETLPIFIFDNNYPIGGASKLWLHNSLVVFK